MPIAPAPLARRAWWCRLVLRALGVSFALVGATFLCAPDATVAALNAAGAALGDFAPAPASPLRFWLSLATGYMVLVTALALVAARDLVRHRVLIALLALGKATSSLTCLAFYLGAAPAFAYLANFVVDGTIALAAAAIWAWVPHLDAAGRAGASPSTAAPAVDRAVHPALAALLEAMLPADGPLPAEARELGVASAVGRFVAAAGPGATAAFRLLLAALEIAPWIMQPWRGRRFSRLSLADRVEVLETWEQSRFPPRRHAMHVLKMVVMLQAYGHPEVAARLGYPHPLTRVPRATP